MFSPEFRGLTTFYVMRIFTSWEMTLFSHLIRIFSKIRGLNLSHHDTLFQGWLGGKVILLHLCLNWEMFVALYGKCVC